LKKFAYILTAALFGATFTGTAAAQDVNVVFVNSARIVEQAPQAKAAQEKIEKEFSSRKDELIAAQKKLKSAQEKLERDGAVVSEAERRKLEREVVTQQRELQRSQEAFREDLNIRRNEEFAKLQREAAKAISGIAEAEGYDLVLEAGVVYASDRADITDEVIERLRKGS
jgi:outer membrane protein